MALHSLAPREGEPGPLRRGRVSHLCWVVPGTTSMRELSIRTSAPKVIDMNSGCSKLSMRVTRRRRTFRYFPSTAPPSSCLPSRSRPKPGRMGDRTSDDPSAGIRAPASERHGNDGAAARSARSEQLARGPFGAALALAPCVWYAHQTKRWGTRHEGEVSCVAGKGRRGIRRHLERQANGGNARHQRSGQSERGQAREPIDRSRVHLASGRRRRAKRRSQVLRRVSPRASCRHKTRKQSEGLMKFAVSSGTTIAERLEHRDNALARSKPSRA
jgi:hypothetical protein